ncbi:MAG: hypothetical protein OHK006_23790 [Thermodesulfovibrionales bacterium]
MKLPEYVTKEEVKRVCRVMKLRDWTKITKPAVTRKEAQAILKQVNVMKMPVPVEEFRRGLEIELEHGTMFKDANVTNNHPLLTGKIVLAHLKEMMDYYERLEVAELEGDLLKATVSGNVAKVRKYLKRLADARIELAEAEAKTLK